MDYYGEVLKTENEEVQENFNPYQKLSYYDQVQKLREDRQMQEGEL